MKRALAALVLGVSVAACGTTVPLAQQGNAAQQGGGLGGGATTGNGATSGDAGTTGSVGSGTGSTGSTGNPIGATTATGSSTAGSSGAGSAGAGGPSTSVLAEGRGITKTTITIGVAIAGGTTQLANAFGIAGAGTLNEADVLNTAVADINRHGGILGRKLLVYTHTFDAAKGIANPSQTYAEICSDFRDDHKVFAVVFNLADPALRSCTASMGSPLLVLDAVSAVVPGSAFQEHGGGWLYGVDNITTERLSKLFIESLVSRNFFEMWNIASGGKGGVGTSKLGLIHVDTPDANALYAAYARDLAKHGLRFTDTVTYKQDASTALASTQSAVLKFRTDGITHVFGASAFFLQDAQSQHYYPRYAYLPGLGALGVANSPAQQLKGAMTVGWSPTSDVEQKEDPGPTTSTKKCDQIMRAAGLQASNRQDVALEYSICDLLNLFRSGLTAGGAPTVAAFRRGVDTLGSSFGSANTLATLLNPTHHYGADVVRDMAFDDSCGCLKYTSRTNRS